MNIPYNNLYFDLGICSFVLHHTDTQIQLLKELKRTCNKILIIENTPKNDKEWSYIKKHAGSYWGKCINCFKNKENWENLFIELGFTILEQKEMSKFYCPFSDKPLFYPVTNTVYLLSS
jgi:ubiquinone/menaquinone biosynthesis C-methylase UbiE